MDYSIPEILFEEKLGKDGNIGLITLNRQQVLNALNNEMFIALNSQLIEWEKNSKIKAVVICASEGRAFCAGGDIKQAYMRKMAKDPALPHFFRDEYRMNLRIHHFPKPYIAFLNGITMGGGAGISLHGSNIIGTEKLTFAMPETAIGFYPDVGTTYYLSRLPYKMGFYLGLTGARISASDCLALGLIQQIVKSDSLDEMLHTLIENALPNKQSVTELLQPFSQESAPSMLLKHRAEIEACFSQGTVEEVLMALEQSQTEWAKKTAQELKTKSPTSLKVTFSALQKAQGLTFDETMQMEYDMTMHFIEENDFFEGIRAVLIDKDQNPHWKPATLAEVKKEQVENYFKSKVGALI